MEAPKATEQEKTAPVFGSGSTAPVFGSGGGGGGGGGFAALASSPAGVGGKTPSSTCFGFGFGSSSSAASGTDPSMVKPLFGLSSSAAATNKTQDDTVGGVDDSDGDETGIAPGSFVTLPDTDEAKTAAAVFDSLDEGKEGRVPASMFEALTDELGEGFHGDEFDKQLAIIDPEGLGFITRPSFVAWYSELVLGGPGNGGADFDAGSLDTEEREEREEERQNADQAFTATAGEGVDTLAVSAFGDLIESMGTTYCEEEHRRTIKMISGEDGAISRGAFITWYLDWLFGGDESDIESDNDEDDEGYGGDGTGGAISASAEGWGGAFGGVEEGSWKCDACMVRNKAADVKCAACETVRPGHEEKAAALSGGGSGGASAASRSGIGAGGFSFGGGGASTTSSTAAAATASSSIGTGGFSFGGAAAAPAPAPLFGSSSASSSSGGGFMFGTPAASAPGPAPAAEIGGGGFAFGIKPEDSTPSRSSSKFPKASPSLTREKSLQGSLEEKIRGMNEYSSKGT